ncbi:MAG: right-handed parallel beta-helix repeat-containing protein [Jatrophihabitans sp.]|uniref:right-handed parallel beta-helix repeat-containing protein n=1 Tax=Jatrophihabitans sp. TaxID=1932789 RepID=UPI003F7EB9F8
MPQSTPVKAVLSLTTLLAATIMFIVGAPIASATVQYTFFASPTGSGTTCSLAAPCSLQGARDKVRTVNTTMTGDIDVDLRGGTYSLSSTFQLTANGTIDDSGFNGNTVVYQAYPGETPVLSGGTTISGWSLYDASKNMYRAAVPSSLDTLQLYVNGAPATIAQSGLYPAGLTYTAGTGAVTISNPAFTGMASWRNPSRIILTSQTSYKHLECPVASYSTSGSNTLAHLAQPCATNVDERLNPGPIYGSFNAVERVENAFELLDTAGEWYLDKAANYLYYIPRPGQNMSTASVIAPTLETLLTGTGDITHPLHNIQISGITFSYATWLRPLTNQGYAAIQGGLLYDIPTGGSQGIVRSHGNIIFTKSEHVFIGGNTFSHLGGVALQLQTGPQYDTIFGNVFTDIAAAAINVGESFETGVDNTPTVDTRLKTYDNLISNNFVENVGTRYTDAVAILAGYSDNTTIDHNEIRNVPYDGIQIGQIGNTDSAGDFSTYSLTAASYQQNNHITNNLIDGVMTYGTDGGAIYTMGTQPGSTLTGNHTRDETNGPGSNCLYMDAATSGYTIDSNVLEGCQHWAVIQLAPAADHNMVVTNNYYSADWGPLTSQLVFDPSDSTNTYANNVQLTLPVQTGAQSIEANAGIQAAYAPIKSCATQGGTCSFDGTRVVSYGSGSTYVQGRFTGSVACNSTVFGDPTPGVTKHCEFADQDLPPSNGIWTYCADANVGQTCSFTGMRTVAIGAMGRFSYGTFTGSVGCNSSVIFNARPLSAYQRCYVLATNQFTDAFASPANWTPNTGTWSVGGGAYIEGATNINTDTVVTGRTWNDSSTEFDTKLVTSGAGNNGWVGVQIRKTASTDNFAQSGYLVYLTAGGVLGIYRPGASLRAVQTDYTFTNVNHVRVSAIGNYIAVYINDSPLPVADVYDSTFTGGYTSLVTSWSSANYYNASVLSQ